MSISLYRKYRPQNFSGVYGQKAAIEIISNSIAKNRVGHAYLFSGSRGCGKTSVARIFAKALNCLDRQNNFEPCGHCSNCTAITQGESLDVIEIDGASNNGVDNIRDLKENVALAPFTSKYKIYIIDEVHMLSQGAFNALLKTLEEPPEHVIFILATTEPHRVPVTIRSRCQHIPFHTISPENIYKRLDEVCGLENLNAEPEALWEIARQADGALRDALSLLEQVTAAGDVTLVNVENSFGAGSRSSFEKWVKNLRTTPDEAYNNLKSMFDSGASGVRIFEEMFSIIKDLWLVSKWQKISDSVGGSELEKNFLREESKNWKPERLHYILTVINKILSQARAGIKNDILLGTFFMMLEQTAPAPVENIQPPLRTSAPRPPAPEEPKPQSMTPPSGMKANAVEFDAELKEKLLNAMHGENFLVYCAIYDARPIEQDGKLILDMEHKYCYEVLRQDRNAAALVKVFSGYSKISVKFGLMEYFCQNFEAPATPAKSKNKERTKKIDAKESEEIPEAQEARNPAPAHNTPSVFDKFKRELAILNAKPEIILIKHMDEENEELEIRNEELEDNDED